MIRKTEYNERNVCVIQCPQMTNRRTLLSDKSRIVTLWVGFMWMDRTDH